MNDAKQTQDVPAINAPTEKEYVDIIRSDVTTDPKYIQEDGEPTKIVYYCRECKGAVKPQRIGKKLSFKCTECDKNVSFGTEESINNYYKVKQKQS